MKIKIQKNSDKEVIISYFKIKETDKFRFRLLKQIIDETGEDIIVIIDTNQHKRAIDFEEISEYLTKHSVKYEVREIPANETKMFGLSLNFLGGKKREPERMFILALTPEAFTQALYDGLLWNYDLAIGFSGQKDFVGITERCVTGIHEVLFKEEYFKNSIYDSGMFETMRSTIDISDLAKRVYSTLK